MSNNYETRYFTNLIGTPIDCKFLRAEDGDLVEELTTGKRFILVAQFPTWKGWSKVKLSGRFFKMWAYELTPSPKEIKK